MAELGKIEKPEAASFEGKKKLYHIRNVYLPEGAPEDYTKLFHTYWDEALQQLEKIETAGKIVKIFCENITVSDKEALDILEKTNKPVAGLIQKKLAEGGTLLPLEREDIFSPFLDWSNCLMVVRSKEVLEKIYGFYTEYLNKRFQHIIDVIEKNLSDTEAGLLIMRDEDRSRIQFPKDIEVFLITPPSYDNILRWMRDQVTKKADSSKSAEEKQDR
ncbi:hypothetical protein EP227_00675 [bacterium]|nr:MAG: hypothetical protein EP227_00675 [bacterium]